MDKVVDTLPAMKKKQVKKWTTKDGTKIRICDMEDSHLINTLKFLKRRANAQLEQYTSLTFSGCPNGEMASYYCDQMCDEIWNSTWEDYIPEIYDSLIIDSARRNLPLPEEIIPTSWVRFS